jgi:hypothetical protein
MDDLARDYLILALTIGRLEDGIVDAYYGPAEIRARAEARDPSPAQQARAAAQLRERAAADPDPQRALWLDRQLTALETLARRLAGEQMDYLDEVERCFDARPSATPPERYRQAHDDLDRLLPAGPSLRERLDSRNERLTVPPPRLPAIIDWLVDRLRRACADVFLLPAGENLSVSMVTNQPWSAYNWYDGELRSRIEFNTDLPVRAPELISLVTHEAFPGHHLEHAWKETRLVHEQGRGEASIQLINTPEAYISEGLAEVGAEFVVDRAHWEHLFADICQRSGIDAGDAAREWEISQSLRLLRAAGGDAALMLHAEGRPREEVLRFLREECLRSEQQALKNLEFISHPLWRTYVFCYAGGEWLLTQWCHAAGDLDAQRGRFLRLLTEQLTPSGIAAEMA